MCFVTSEDSKPHADILCTACSLLELLPSAMDKAGRVETTADCAQDCVQEWVKSIFSVKITFV